MLEPAHELKTLCDSLDCANRMTCAVHVEGSFTTFRPTFKIERTHVEDRVTCVSYRKDVQFKGLRLIS